jgi:hypothetical protein
MDVARFARSGCIATRLPLSRHGLACLRRQAGPCRASHRCCIVVASRAAARFPRYMAQHNRSSRGASFFALDARLRWLEAQSSRLGDDAVLIMFATVAILATTFERAVGTGLDHCDRISTHARLGDPQDNRSHRRDLGL